MTRMLVRIVDADEAILAAKAGVDAIELHIADDGDLAIARAARLAFGGLLRLRFDGLSVTSDFVARAVSVQADEIALDLAGASPPLPLVDAKVPASLSTVAIVLTGPDLLESVQRVRGRVQVIMLDDSPARIMTSDGIAQLDAFASACRAAGLPFGLAGGLEAPDVARLLLLEPNMLGFDLAVRRAHRADGPLEPAALDAIRALIPGGSSPQASLDRTPGPAPIDTVTDCVFVRDFAISLAIGAYQAEHGKRQRVRFSVDADVVRRPRPPHDMRDVFSYDVIIETIRVLSQRPHVTFVETLAEEVAMALLAHADLVAVKVKVEKLDVVEGSVGIEIVRRRRQP